MYIQASSLLTIHTSHLKNQVACCIIKSERNRTSIPIALSFHIIRRNNIKLYQGWMLFLFLLSMYDNPANITSNKVKTSSMLIGHHPPFCTRGQSLFEIHIQHFLFIILFHCITPRILVQLYFLISFSYLSKFSKSTQATWTPPSGLFYLTSPI